MRSLVTILWFSTSALAVSEPPASSSEDFIRIRCNLDQTNSWFQWSGSVYSYVPGERQKKLFNLVGMNVARCLPKASGGWVLTSRELVLFQDPISNQVLKSWKNPWTGVQAHVAHTANSPVQVDLSRSFPIREYGQLATVRADVNLFYPNPLDGIAELEPYSFGKLYQAGEFFQWTLPTSQLQAGGPIKDVTGNWQRISPWLPWMQMGQRPGFLVYSAEMEKVDAFDDLKEVLRQEIDARLPRYRSAPKCVLETENATSLTEFLHNFSYYLAGEPMPVPAPLDPSECEGHNHF